MASLDYKEDARDLHAFKELRFFLSHAVPLEICCSISRLELPLVADYLLGSPTSNPYNQHQQAVPAAADGPNQGNGIPGHDGSGGKGNGASREAMDGIVRRIVSEPELVATCQVFSDGQPMHAVPMRYSPTKAVSTHSSAYKTNIQLYRVF